MITRYIYFYSGEEQGQNDTIFKTSGIINLDKKINGCDDYDNIKNRIRLKRSPTFTITALSFLGETNEIQRKHEHLSISDAKNTNNAGN